MKTIEELKKEPRLNITQIGLDGGMGWIYLPISKRPLAVIFSNGGGWNHVSVSHRNKTPSWEEMCMVKDIFFHKDEVAIQYHPKEEDYINNHPYTLHIWQPQNETIPTPPKEFV